MTISEAMVLLKTIRSRIGELQTLRDKNAVKENIFYRIGEEEKKRVETEPQYDPKIVDKKVVELQGILFKVDSAIKRANAITDIKIEVDIDKILEPIS